MASFNIRELDFGPDLILRALMFMLQVIEDLILSEIKQQRGLSTSRFLPQEGNQVLSDLHY